MLIFLPISMMNRIKKRQAIACLLGEGYSFPYRSIMPTISSFSLFSASSVERLMSLTISSNCTSWDIIIKIFCDSREYSAFTQKLRCLTTLPPIENLGTETTEIMFLPSAGAIRIKNSNLLMSFSVCDG